MKPSIDEVLRTHQLLLDAIRCVAEVAHEINDDATPFSPGNWLVDGELMKELRAAVVDWTRAGGALCRAAEKLDVNENAFRIVQQATGEDVIEAFEKVGELLKKEVPT